MFEELLKSNVVKVQVAIVVKDNALVQEKKYFLAAPPQRGEQGKMFQITFDPLTGQSLDSMSIDAPAQTPRKRNSKK